MVINSQTSEKSFSKQNDQLPSEGKSVNDINTDSSSIDHQLLGLSTNSGSTIQKKESQTNTNTTSSLPQDVKGKMEHSFSTDFSNVKIHSGSSKANEIGADAYTQGNEIHFAPGKFDPHGNTGQQLLAHELTHVVQQRNGKVKPTTQNNGLAINDDHSLEKEADELGAKATKGQKSFSGSTSVNNTSSVVQGFFSQTHKGKPYKVSDDLSLAVKEGYPNHILFAKPGMAASANTKLSAVGSGIELEERTAESIFTNGGKAETLKRVIPKNKQNNTKGRKMDLWADCGKSNAVVVGGSSRKAAYKDGGSLKWTAAGSPTQMKSEIMQNWLNKKYSDVSTPTATKTKVKAALDAAKVVDSKMAQKVADYTTAKTDSEREAISDSYYALMEEKAEKLWSYYNSLPTTSKESIDKEIGINRYARPTIGQGYTTSTGGAPVKGHENETWNFHWGGVVMESIDTNDKVVLENYAVGDPMEQNHDWEFAMYMFPFASNNPGR
jgi:hypothetical protein